MTTPQRSLGDAVPLRAVISTSALAQNARGLCGVADLRRDAFGHGLDACAPVLAACGLRLLVDAEAEVSPELPGLITEPCGDLIDPAALWGLPGGGSRPVMSVHGSVLSTKPLYAGEAVSYGYTFRTASDTRVALVCGGYAQGIVREIGNHVRVTVGGTTAPIVGRVAMDACVIEIGDGDVVRGDDVVFFGDPAAGQPELAAWLTATGMTAVEVVGLVGARARREVAV